MNIWFVFAIVFLVLVLCLVTCARRQTLMDRVVVLELASITWTLALVCFAEGADRDIYFTLPLVLTVTSFVGSLVYVRILERWL